jgi:putative transposase
MPNHFHGIVVITDTIVGADLRVGPVPEGAHTGAPLPTVIQWFKTMTTNEYIRGVKTASWPSFNGRLWQRNYYEHIIRNEESLNRIRQYILDNLARGAFDRENPEATAPDPGDPWL